MTNYKEYVVKPQKEGGGNNFYDEEAKELLEKFVSKDTSVEEKESLKQFMIMSRIHPPMLKSWMLKDGQLHEVDSLSELGIYSCLFIDVRNRDLKWSQDQLGNMRKHFGVEDELIMKNEMFGTLMRTKGSHSNEGGVNTGYAVID